MTAASLLALASMPRCELDAIVERIGRVERIDCIDRIDRVAREAPERRRGRP